MWLLFGGCVFKGVEVGWRRVNKAIKLKRTIGFGFCHLLSKKKLPPPPRNVIELARKKASRAIKQKSSTDDMRGEWMGIEDRLPIGSILVHRAEYTINWKASLARRKQEYHLAASKIIRSTQTRELTHTGVSFLLSSKHRQLLFTQIKALRPCISRLLSYLFASFVFDLLWVLLDFSHMST